MILESFLALVVSALAAIGLYFGWRHKSPVYALLGWLSVVGSVYVWYLALNLEFGVTIALLLPALTVWLGIASQATRQRQLVKRVKPAHQWKIAPGQIARNTGHILYVLPGQMFICAIIMIAVVYQLPMSEPKQLATGALMMPVLWGILAYWYVLSSRKWVHIILSLSVASFAGWWLFGGIHG